MLEVAFVQQPEMLTPEKEESLDILVFGDGLSDVVYLRAVVLSARVFNKEDSRNGEPARYDVDELIVRGAPDGVKLSLDEDLGALPNYPTKHGRSAVLCDVRIDEREALVLRRAVLRRARNIERGGGTADNLANERFDVRLYQFGRTHGEMANDTVQPQEPADEGRW